MNFEKPPQEKTKEEGQSAENSKESSILEAPPGKLVYKFKGDAKDAEGNDLDLYAQIKKTPEGEFAVIKGFRQDWDSNKSVEENAEMSDNKMNALLAEAPKFTNIEQANEELMRLAELNNWQWAAANDYEGYEKQWEGRKESEPGE